MTAQPSLPLYGHAAELSRVKSRLANEILAFCRTRPLFHGDDLRAHIAKTIGACAPGSADRILRALRAEGRIAYRVVSRRESLYEVQEVA